MKTRTVASAAAAGLLATAGPLFAGSKDVCVSISDIYRGRNCGTAESMQVEVTNYCGVTVAGELIFRQEKGEPIRQALVLNSSDKRTVFVCTSNGEVDKNFEPK